MSKYKFKTEPFTHQKVALEKCWNKNEYALFMEMGTGKTKVIIDNIGILKTSKKVGGVGNLLKILSPNEQELKTIIYQYLKENYYPDYNWGPELHDFYRQEIKQYGIYDFLINDDPAYSYLGEWDGYDYLYTLSIGNRVRNELTELFGDKWIPVFKKWFEDNSGLEVRDIDLENKYLVY